MGLTPHTPTLKNFVPGQIFGFLKRRRPNDFALQSVVSTLCDETNKGGLFMAMAILRTAKLKSLGNLAASLSHTYRTRETHNADPQRYDDNTLERSPQAVLEDLKAKLPDKRRKDAVLCIEYMVSASPQWFEGKPRAQQDTYFEDAKRWLIERHGAANVLDFSIHRDEKSPHAVAYVVPLDEGKLNAKKWLGGRAALSAMQTDFAKRVGHGHGLERGVEGSKATHTTVKEFYAALNAPVKHVQIPPQAVEPRVLKKGVFTNEFETSEAVADRLTKGVQKYYEAGLLQAQEAALLWRRTLEQQKTMQSLERDKKNAERRVLRLSEEFCDLMELAQMNPVAYRQVKALAKQKLQEGKQLQKERELNVRHEHSEKGSPLRQSSNDRDLDR